MKIRFLTQYGMYHPGMVTDQIPGGVADVLVRRKIAVEVPDVSPLAPPLLADAGETVASEAVDHGSAQRLVEGAEETPKSARQRNRR